MTGRFLLFFLFRASIPTLHMRVHLKHFELLLYIRNFAHSNNDFSTALEHRIDCSIEKHRDRTLSGRGLRLMRLIFWFLLFYPSREHNESCEKDGMRKSLAINIGFYPVFSCNYVNRVKALSLFMEIVKKARFFTSKWLFNINFFSCHKSFWISREFQ